jgi:hypothetical protein
MNFDYSRRNRVDLATEDPHVLDVAEHMASAIGAERARKYTAVEFAECKRHVLIVLLDLKTAWDANQELYVGYSRGKGNFENGGPYWDEVAGHCIVSYAFYITVVDFLAGANLIENHVAKPGRNSYSSRMRATPALSDLFVGAKALWASTLVDLDAQRLFVRDDEKNIVAYPDPGDFDLDKAIQNLRRINENLQSSCINIAISDVETVALQNKMRGGEQVGVTSDDEDPSALDFSDRAVRRLFAQGSFERGGRFYGGWWQGVPSELRKYIEVDGLMTVELDFASIQPRMLYALADENPYDDAYVLPGWGLEFRPIAKKAFNQLLNSSQSSRNPNHWPQRFAPTLSLLNESPPADWNAKNQNEKLRYIRALFTQKTNRDYDQFLTDLLNFHAPIDSSFFSGAWAEMQFLDSQIAEKTMIKLLDQGVTALPIHDSFIVRRGAERLLDEAMKNAFKEVVGIDALVDADTSLFEAPEGYEPELVYGIALANESKEHFKTHSKYHQREYDWLDARGLGGVD